MNDAKEIAAPAGRLLSRYAEATFWLARYMERIENLARLLDVTETFVRGGGGDAANWFSIVQINADEARFAERYAHATAETVTQFYLLDLENSTSIAASIGFARENARTLRPLISTEMWTHINVFYNTVRRLTNDDVSGSRLSNLCAMLKQECQAHFGITEGTFFRDEGWAFYSIGKYLERADQTTRLVDIKYHTLLPSVDAVGSALDAGQWNALLRAAAGYHAFRRIHPRGMSPALVAGFLLLNGAFPRSLVLCVRQAEWHLGQLRARYELRGGAPALERFDALRSLLDVPIDLILARGLHEFLDAVQRDLIAIGADVGAAFWSGE